MAVAGLRASIIKVAGAGLNLSHLGANVTDDSTRAMLERLHVRFGLHPCGEGGEYETFTTACPLFVRDIAMCAAAGTSTSDPCSRASEAVLLSDPRQADPYSIVAHLRITDAALVAHVPSDVPFPASLPTPPLLDAIATALEATLIEVRATLARIPSSLDSP